MATNSEIALLGALGGALVTGVLGLIRQYLQERSQDRRVRIRERSQDRRRRAEMYLERKVEILTGLHSVLMETLEYVGSGTDGLSLSGTEILNDSTRNEFISKVEELKRKYNKYMFYLDEGSRRRVDGVVSLLVSMEEELKKNETNQFVWEDLDVPNKNRINPDGELKKGEIHEIMENGLQSLRDEIQGPIEDFEEELTESKQD